jgi:2-octaprenyl-6-methoxyphenol hydroxylase
MAEAAHVVPPIGAQGLNMSLGDLRVLVGLATADRAGLGGHEMLAAYARARHPEVAARVAGIDLLNRASMAGAQGVRDLRAGLVSALYSAAPVRKTLMRAGLGLGLGLSLPTGG